MRFRRVLQSAVIAASLSAIEVGCKGLNAGDEFENPPISYYDSLSNDAVARLNGKITGGEVQLEPDANGEYLESLLTALAIDASSQCLVFSKTSLQINHIGPRTPRAIYFNDEVYVGYVPGSGVLELVAIDPQLGSVFYTLEAIRPSSVDERPEPSTSGENRSFQIIRDRGQCLSCHATTRTERVPGVLVRSIYSDKAGRPRSGASTFVTDHRSPFLNRWGGWYVTGDHGAMLHMGNVFAVDRNDPELLDRSEGANWDSLSNKFNTKLYLTSKSDIVALMVLEHQTRIQNLLTRANYETRQALFHDKTMNEALGRPSDHRSDSTTRRIAAVGDDLVQGLLFADEFPLANPVGATSRYRDDFQAKGNLDSQGRSLRELDLKNRLFKYSCSYLIFSTQFNELPKECSSYVAEKLVSILRGNSPAPKGVLWSPEDREQTLQILENASPKWLNLAH